MPTEINRRLRNRASNRFKQAVQRAVYCFEKTLAEQSDSKPFWSYVKSKQRYRPPVGPIKNRNGLTTDDPEECADIVAECYQECFTVEDMTSFPSVPPITSVDLTFVNFTPVGILKQLRRLPNNSAPGADGISYMLIKQGGFYLAAVLADFYQYCFDTSQTPKDWRTACVIPVFKKGDRTDAANYRPVSLLSALSKVMESVVRETMFDFWVANNVLKSSQFGFRPEACCSGQLLSYLEDISHYMDKRNYADSIYVDFCKAFNTVPHQRLLCKLKAAGINGNLYKWIRSYLMHRTEKVCIQGKTSKDYAMTSGVPQGSVLGPLLFILYIDDLGENFQHSIILKYADDVKLFREIKRSHPQADQSLLQADLSRLSEWSSTWQLQPAPPKCAVLHFGRNNPSLSYTLFGQPLLDPDTQKDLGVVVSSDLNWTPHLNKVIRCAEIALHTLTRTLVSRSPYVYLKLYKSFVRPHLEFATQVWSPYKKMDIQRIERVQRRATKRVHHCRGLPYEERLKVLSLDSLKRRRLFFDLCYVYKLLTGKVYGDKEHFFQLDETRRTRGHAFKLKYPFCAHNYRKQYFSFRVIHFWNKLPPDVVLVHTLSAFKRNLSTFLDSIGII